MIWNDGAVFECHLEPEGAPTVARRSICSLGSSPQSSTSTTQQQSQSGPPAFIQPFLQQGIGDLVNQFNQNPNGPAYYPGQTVASFSPQTQSAIDAETTRATDGSPVVSSADAANQATTSGSYLDLQNNPYFQSAIAAAQEPGTRSFTNTVLPAITSQFAAAGRGNSGLQGSAINDATDTFATAQANAADTAANTAYGQERTLQNQATALAPTLANQDYVDINQLGSAGQTVDNQSQANIDANVAKYNYNSTEPMNYITQYLAALNGGYPGGTNSGTSSGTTTTTPASNAFSSLFGAGSSAAGLGLTAYGLGLF